MNNLEGQEGQAVLRTDADILGIEEGLRPRVEAFLLGLRDTKRLHPDVAVRIRVDDSSFIVAANEHGVDGTMLEGNYVLTLELLAEAAHHRRNPHIDVSVECRAETRKKIRDAFETMNLYAIKHGAVIFNDEDIKSQETNTPTGEDPRNGNDSLGYSKTQTYRFSPPCQADIT